jgi:hypothetical protein
MYFILKSLTAELIYIRWYMAKSSEASPLSAFISQLGRTLNEAPQPLYFLSDLRYGRILDIAVIQQLGGLTKHPNWAGSAAFSANPISQMLVGNFNRMRSDGKRKNREIYDTPEEVIASLEVIKPGVSGGVDWIAILSA